MPAFEWPPGTRHETPGHLTSLEVFGSPVVIPTGVNARGDVVGVYLGTDDQPHGFLNHHGEAQDIGTLGGSSAVANAISNNGMVVGASVTAGGAIHALAYDRTLHDLGTALPTDSYSEAFSVNEAGVAVGRSGQSPGDAVAAIFKSGHVESIGTLGGETSAATDVNDGGVVVGFAQLSNGAEHAFLYGGLKAGERMLDLGLLGGMNSIAGSINDRGTHRGPGRHTATAATGLADAFVDYGAGLVDLNSLIPATAQHHWDLVQALTSTRAARSPASACLTARLMPSF